MDKRFIDACEAEALHLSAAIQPHGALVVTDALGMVRYFSRNIDQFLPSDQEIAVDGPLPDNLRLLLGQLGLEPGSRCQFGALIEGVSGPLDVVFGRNAQGFAIIEIMPGLDEALLNAALKAPGSGVIRWDTMDIPQGQAALIEKIAELTGFQRVMYYSFREDGDGEVLAEFRQPGVIGSYLGLRFPASDIPLVARQLYKLNPWRLIPDAQAASIPVVGSAGEPPDLSYSDLRSVSPVHQLYLANMGVAASLSFPVVIADQLSGLIACHHALPRQLALSTLSEAAQQVRLHTLSVTCLTAHRRMQLVDGLARRFDQVSALVQEAGSLLAAWPKLGSWLVNEFAADGASLSLGEGCEVWGEGFEPEVLSFFDNWFVAEKLDAVWLSDSLSRKVPDFPLSGVAGVLAIKARLSGGRMLRLYLMRHEYTHDVAWGGNPDKPVEHHDGVLGIAPRRSFEKWVEKRMGYCRPWDNEARLLGLKLRELLVRLLRDA